MGVCDISADFEGSIELTSQFTNIDEPFIVYDINKDEFRDKINKADQDCILFHSVDHLPAEMPKEASNHFGSKLYPFVEAVVNSNIKDSWATQVEQLPGEISNAIMTCHGTLTPNYNYITELRKINEEQESNKLTEEF
jgi:alpha-aminoadipic semialdehyde synthase